VAARRRPARRGPARQRERRRREHAARRHAAEVGRKLAARGWAWRTIAELLHVAGRTLRQWCRDLLDWLRPAAWLGRPVTRSPRECRQAAIDLLDELGPGVGVPTLRECFPGMRRAELADLLSRYRRVWRARHQVPLRILDWPVAGRVWAIDFAEPPVPIDGRYRYLVAVRDLASGRQLAWRPLAEATGAESAAVLAGLFAEHGPPLVVKCDNGGAFTGPAVGELLATHGVERLVSPPSWPRYNGSVEAGIGSLKDRTEARAARQGHAGYWTADDVAGALAEANTLARPHGPAGPSPEALWSSRTPITTDERVAFAAAVSRHRVSEACGAEANGVPSEPAKARAAVRRALEECGYLHYSRRRILPAITRRKAARLT
jgi:transposase InsO family protein